MARLTEVFTILYGSITKMSRSTLNVYVEITLSLQTHWENTVQYRRCRLRELAMASFPKAQLKRFNDVEPHGPICSDHKLAETPYSDREVRGLRGNVK